MHEERSVQHWELTWERLKGDNIQLGNFSMYLKRVKSTGSGSVRSDLLEIKEEFEHLRWFLVHIKYIRSAKNFKKQHIPDMISKSNRLITFSSTGTMVDADQEMDEDEEEGIGSESSLFTNIPPKLITWLPA